MWNEKELKKTGLSIYDLGNFSKGIPKLLDLLEDPMKIPRLYTWDGREGGEIFLGTFKPYSEADELTVKNFRQGLIRVAEKSERFDKEMQEKRRLRVYSFFDNNGNVGRENFEKFLSLSIGYGEQVYSLKFFQNTRKSYVAKVGESEPKFADIMRECIGPNVMRKEVHD